MLPTGVVAVLEISCWAPRPAINRTGLEDENVGARSAAWTMKRAQLTAGPGECQAQSGFVTHQGGQGLRHQAPVSFSYFCTQNGWCLINRWPTGSWIVLCGIQLHPHTTGPLSTMISSVTAIASESMERTAIANRRTFRVEIIDFAVHSMDKSNLHSSTKLNPIKKWKAPLGKSIKMLWK